MLEGCSSHACFGGTQYYYQHQSKVIGLPMRFSAYIPHLAKQGPVPVLFFLAGLTSTEETFMIKAGAQRLAAEYGIILVSVDTSPRQTGIVGETDSWDLGAGAGFYLDATQAPWSQYFKMESYITQELYELVLEEFPVDSNKIGIWGHSMGGHGALIFALKYPKLYCSVSAFAPLAAPIYSSLGQKAFRNYLGEDRQLWRKYDTTALIEDGCRIPEPLIDQGLNDEFFSELCPDRLETACKAANQPLTLRYHKNYDHGYYFVSTFVADHMKHHVDIFANR